MTNYNDGKWHAWNGGECPVHPETLVKIAWTVQAPDYAYEPQKARSCNWQSNQIAAFCVTKQHTPPTGWQYDVIGNNIWSSSDLIAQVLSDPDTNGPLLAAAPDLRDALSITSDKLMMVMITANHSEGAINVALDPARKALAKTNSPDGGLV